MVTSFPQSVHAVSLSPAQSRAFFGDNTVLSEKEIKQIAKRFSKVANVENFSDVDSITLFPAQLYSIYCMGLNDGIRSCNVELIEALQQGKEGYR